MNSSRSKSYVLFSNRNILSHLTYKRYFSILPIISRVLKLRYLFIGSAVGGGIAIQNVSKKKKTKSIVWVYSFLFIIYFKTKKYENFRSNLPDLSWMKEFVSDETYDNFTDKMRNVYDTIHPPNLVK